MCWFDLYSQELPLAFAWNLLLVIIWSPGWESPLGETAASGNPERRSSLGLCVTENPCDSLHAGRSLEISTCIFLPWVFSLVYSVTVSQAPETTVCHPEERVVKKIASHPFQNSVHRRPTVRWGITGPMVGARMTDTRVPKARASPSTGTLTKFWDLRSQIVGKAEVLVHKSGKYFTKHTDRGWNDFY